MMELRFNLLGALFAFTIVSAQPAAAQAGYVAVGGVGTFIYGSGDDAVVLENREFTFGAYPDYSAFDADSNSFAPLSFWLSIDGLWSGGETYVSQPLILSATGTRVSLGSVISFDIPGEEPLFELDTARTFPGGNIDISGFVDLPTTAFPITLQSIESVSLHLNFTADAPIPEPATWAMLITGFGLVGVTARRQRPRPA